MKQYLVTVMDNVFIDADDEETAIDLVREMMEHKELSFEITAEEEKE